MKSNMKSIGEIMMEGAHIPPKDILEHPERYEQVVLWQDSQCKSFEITYRKRKS